MKQQADVQKYQADMANEKQKEQTEQQMRMAEMAFEADQKEKDRQAEIAKTQMQEATKIEVARINAELSAQVEMTREQNRAKPVSQEWDDTGLRESLGAGNEQMAQVLMSLQQTMQALAEGITRPRTVSRGPDGRVNGLQ